MKGLAVATNDAELLEQWTTRGDARAFDSLVAGYSGLVYSACRRILGNDADAQDATQECFLQLAQRTPKIQTSLAAWLHTVATGKAISRIREESRRARREQSYAKDADTTVEADWDDIQEFVDEAIRALPAENRAPLTASFLERKTHADIAKEIGVDRSTISRRIDRGIEGIRDHLKAKGVIATSASLMTMLTTKMTEAMPVGLTATLAKIALTGGRLQAVGGVMGGGFLGGIFSFVGGMTVGKAVTGAAALAALLGALWFMNPQDAPTESVVSPTAETAPATETEMEIAKVPESPESSTIEAASVAMSEEVDVNASTEDAKSLAPSIEGIVYDASNNKGLEGIELIAYPEGDAEFVAAQVTTDGDGRYAMSQLGAGRFRIVTPEIEGFFETYDGGKTIRVEIPESSGAVVEADIELNRGGVLSGVAMFGSEPIRELMIEFRTETTSGTSPGRRISARTDSRGRFRIEDLPEFKGQAIPSFIDAKGLKQDAMVLPLDIKLNSVTEKTVRFSAGTGSIEGTVYYANKETPIQAKIEINFLTKDKDNPEAIPIGGKIRIKTDADGYFFVDALPAAFAEMWVFARIEGQIVNGQRVEEPREVGPKGNLTESFFLAEGEHVHKDFIFSSAVVRGRIINIPPGTVLMYLVAHAGERTIEMKNFDEYLEARDSMISYDQQIPVNGPETTQILRGLKPGRYTISAFTWPTEPSFANMEAYGTERLFRDIRKVSTYITVGESDQLIDVVLDFAAP